MDEAIAVIVRESQSNARARLFFRLSQLPRLPLISKARCTNHRSHPRKSDKASAQRREIRIAQARHSPCSQFCSAAKESSDRGAAGSSDPQTDLRPTPPLLHSTNKSALCSKFCLRSCDKTRPASRSSEY